MANTAKIAIRADKINKRMNSSLHALRLRVWHTLTYVSTPRLRGSYIETVWIVTKYVSNRSSSLRVIVCLFSVIVIIFFVFLLRIFAIPIILVLRLRFGGKPSTFHSPRQFGLSLNLTISQPLFMF